LINDLTLKIADFGLSRFISNNTLATTSVGTPIYMAPEIYQKMPEYGHKAEVWSVGLIVYKGLFRKLPEFLVNCLDIKIYLNFRIATSLRISTFGMIYIPGMKSLKLSSHLKLKA
jgi:serine/threonine protein kinase